MAISRNLCHCKIWEQVTGKVFIHRNSQLRHLTHFSRHLAHDFQKAINVPSHAIEEIDVILSLKCLNICVYLSKKPIIFFQYKLYYMIHLRGSRYILTVLNGMMRHKGRDSCIRLNRMSGTPG